MQCRKWAVQALMIFIQKKKFYFIKIASSLLSPFFSFHGWKFPSFQIHDALMTEFFQEVLHVIMSHVIGRSGVKTSGGEVTRWQSLSPKNATCNPSIILRGTLQLSGNPNPEQTPRHYFSVIIMIDYYELMVAL